MQNDPWAAFSPQAAPAQSVPGIRQLTPPAPPKPKEPRIMKMGDQIGIVGDDGSFTPTYAAPEKPPAPKPRQAARIPVGAVTGIQENLKALREIETSLDALNKRPQSIGTGTGWLGDTFTQLNDPDGTDVRSRVANIGAVKIHDLSGAAVSASEAPRFTPFVPKVDDTPVVARQKLENFRENLRAQVKEQLGFYTPENGYTPYQSPDADAFLAGGEQERPPENPLGVPTQKDDGGFFAVGKDGVRLEYDPETKDWTPVVEGGSVGSPVQAAQLDAQKIAEREGQAGAGDLFGQGAMLGLGDQAAGVGNAIYNAVSSPFTDAEFDPARAYTAGRDAENMRLDEARQRLGAGGTALEIGGGLFSGNVSGALKAAPTLMGKVGQGMRAGATGGAIAGYGYGEGAVGSAMSALAGAGIGAGVGAALPIAGQVIGNRVDGLRRLTGKDPGLPRRIVGEAIEADANTPAAAGAMMDEAGKRGSPMMLADTGDNARELMASVGRQPGPSRAIVRNAVGERQKAQAERISAAVVRDLGPTANIREMGEELITRARTTAKPLYKKFEQAPGASSVKLEDLAMRPAFRKALRNAAELAAEEGEDGLALGFQFDEAGDVLLTDVPSFKTLDYIKRGMDDVVETYRDKTTGKLALDGRGHATNATLRTLIARIDKVNPAYAEARAAYAGPAKIKEAMDKGFKALNKSPDDIQAMLKNLGESEKEGFRLGVRKAIVDLLGSRKDGGDKVSLLIGTPKSRFALTKVFGGRAEFDRFIATLRDEQAMGQTYGSVYGNSATAGRAAQDAQTGDTGLAETAVDAALRGGKDGMWSALVSSVQKLRDVERFGAGEAGQRARESVAALLSETDPLVLKDLISAATKAAGQQRARNVSRSRGAVRTGRNVGQITGMGAGSLSEK